jgi:energy-coupling factor transporter transmembrane protein EcfT
MRTAPGLPFEYRPGGGPLRRWPAPLKLLALLFLSAAAYASLPGLCAAAVLCAAGALTAGIRPGKLLRGSGPLFRLALLFLLLRALEFDPGEAPFFRLRGAAIPGGLRQGLAMIVSFCAGALFFAVTTTGELRESLGGPARLGLRYRAGLSLSLALAFLPRFFEIWEAADRAWRARGGRKNLARIAALLPLAAEGMLESAFNTAEALEARGAFRGTD